MSVATIAGSRGDGGDPPRQTGQQECVAQGKVALIEDCARRLVAVYDAIVRRGLAFPEAQPPLARRAPAHEVARPSGSATTFWNGYATTRRRYYGSCLISPCPSPTIRPSRISA
jgi:hypothetical protein